MDDGVKTIVVSSGSYSFRIRDNTLWSSDKTMIYSRNFKIGGDVVDDCVNVCIIYKNGIVDYAYIPTIFYDPHCSIIDKGGGTVVMIRTLLSYVSSQIPSLTHVRFDDMSNIECATEEEIRKGSRFRKQNTYVKPMPLYYFSILFNGETWYERHFKAKQMDEIKHQAYRKKVEEFLYSPEFKQNMVSGQFVSLFGKSELEMQELLIYYNKHKTFSDFFKSIPKEHHCRLIGSWIEQFMRVTLKDTFSNNDWMIPLQIGGGNKRKKSRKTRKYYCPKGVIRNNYRTQNICISIDDV